MLITIRLRLLAVFILLCVITNTNAEEINGGQIYKQNCTRCHSADGSGYHHRFPALTDSALYKENLTATVQVIQQGRRRMPGFGKRLSPDDLSNLVSYMAKTFAGVDVDLKKLAGLVSAPGD